MQDMLDEALGIGAPRIQRISGRGCCCNCESEIFQIVIYNDGRHEIACADPQCRTFWSPLGQGSGPLTCLFKAMGEGGDESGDVVQEKKGYLGF